MQHSNNFPQQFQPGPGVKRSNLGADFCQILSGLHWWTAFNQIWFIPSSKARFRQLTAMFVPDFCCLEQGWKVQIFVTSLSNTLSPPIQMNFNQICCIAPSSNWVMQHHNSNINKNITSLSFCCCCCCCCFLFFVVVFFVVFLGGGGGGLGFFLPNPSKDEYFVGLSENEWLSVKLWTNWQQCRDLFVST